MKAVVRGSGRPVGARKARLAGHGGRRPVRGDDELATDQAAAVARQAAQT